MRLFKYFFILLFALIIVNVTFVTVGCGSDDSTGTTSTTGTTDTTDTTNDTSTTTTTTTPSYVGAISGAVMAGGSSGAPRYKGAPRRTGEANANGTPISGATVLLFKNDTTTTSAYKTTTTTSTGAYSFNELPDGDYYVFIVYIQIEGTSVKLKVANASNIEIGANAEKEAAEASGSTYTAPAPVEIAPLEPVEDKTNPFVKFIGASTSDTNGDWGNIGVINGTGKIVIGFSEPVDRTKISNISITDNSVDVNVEISSNIDGTEYSIKASDTAGFPAGHSLTIDIPKTIVDIAGNALSDTATATVGIAAAAITGNVSVVSSYPSDGETIAKGAKISINFDAPIDISTLKDNVTLTKDDASVTFPKGKWSASGKSAVYDLAMDPVLKILSGYADGNYSLVLGTGIKDINGRTLASAVTISFTVKTQTVAIASVIKDTSVLDSSNQSDYEDALSGISLLIDTIKSSYNSRNFSSMLSVLSTDFTRIDAEGNVDKVKDFISDIKDDLNEIDNELNNMLIPDLVSKDGKEYIKMTYYKTTFDSIAQYRTNPQGKSEIDFEKTLRGVSDPKSYLVSDSTYYLLDLQPAEKDIVKADNGEWLPVLYKQSEGGTITKLTSASAITKILDNDKGYVVGPVFSRLILGTDIKFDMNLDIKKISFTDTTTLKKAVVTAIAKLGIKPIGNVSIPEFIKNEGFSKIKLTFTVQLTNGQWLAMSMKEENLFSAEDSYKDPKALDKSENMSSMFPGDEIDNDGDNKIDEELPNGIDDDNDGLVDEDLQEFIEDNQQMFVQDLGVSVDTGGNIVGKKVEGAVSYIIGIAAPGVSFKLASFTEADMTVDGDKLSLSAATFNSAIFDTELFKLFRKLDKGDTKTDAEIDTEIALYEASPLTLFTEGQDYEMHIFITNKSAEDMKTALQEELDIQAGVKSAEDRTHFFMVLAELPNLRFTFSSTTKAAFKDESGADLQPKYQEQGLNLRGRIFLSDGLTWTDEMKSMIENTGFAVIKTNDDVEIAYGWFQWQVGINGYEFFIPGVAPGKYKFFAGANFGAYGLKDGSLVVTAVSPDSAAGQMRGMSNYFKFQDGNVAIDIPDTFTEDFIFSITLHQIMKKSINVKVMKTNYTGGAIGIGLLKANPLQGGIKNDDFLGGAFFDEFQLIEDYGVEINLPLNVVLPLELFKKVDTTTQVTILVHNDANQNYSDAPDVDENGVGDVVGFLGINTLPAEPNKVTMRALGNLFNDTPAISLLMEIQNNFKEEIGGLPLANDIPINVHPMLDFTKKTLSIDRDYKAKSVLIGLLFEDDNQNAYVLAGIVDFANSDMRQTIDLTQLTLDTSVLAAMPFIMEEMDYIKTLTPLDINSALAQGLYSISVFEFNETKANVESAITAFLNGTESDVDVKILLMSEDVGIYYDPNSATGGVISQDSDNDGLLDKQEQNLGTNPNSQDSDNDGLLDGEEVNKFQTDPLNNDSDGDGLNDGDEVFWKKSNPLVEDTDGDGYNDWDETIKGSDPTDSASQPPSNDKDFDGISDSDETSGYDITNRTTWSGNELSDLTSVVTDPFKTDSDGDGIPDGMEKNETKTDPREKDTDGDGVSDLRELDNGFDPNDANSTPDFTNITDSDNDGLSDDEEAERGTNPQLSDSDDDGLSDYDEIVLYHTNPMQKDSDWDELSDGAEINGFYINGETVYTNPYQWDSDNDGFSDKDELEKGYNPVDSSDAISIRGKVFVPNYQMPAADEWNNVSVVAVGLGNNTEIYGAVGIPGQNFIIKTGGDTGEATYKIGMRPTSDSFYIVGIYDPDQDDEPNLIGYKPAAVPTDQMPYDVFLGIASDITEYDIMINKTPDTGGGGPSYNDNNITISGTLEFNAPFDTENYSETQGISIYANVYNPLAGLPGQLDYTDLYNLDYAFISMSKVTFNANGLVKWSLSINPDSAAGQFIQIGASIELDENQESLDTGEFSGRTLLIDFDPDFIYNIPLMMYNSYSYFSEYVIDQDEDGLQYRDEYKFGTSDTDPADVTLISGDLIIDSAAIVSHAADSNVVVYFGNVVDTVDIWQTYQTYGDSVEFVIDNHSGSNKVMSIKNNRIPYTIPIPNTLLPLNDSVWVLGYISLVDITKSKNFEGPQNLGQVNTNQTLTAGTPLTGVDITIDITMPSE